MTPANDNRLDGASRGPFPPSTLFAVVAAVVVGLTMLAAIAVSDPPWVVRDLKRDQDLTARLYAVQQSIANYHHNENKLPANLADLLASPQTTPFEATAENLKEIDYSPGADGRSYELCTVFLRASSGANTLFSQTWKHDAGRSCFKLKLGDKLGWLPGRDGTLFVRN